MSQQSLPPAAKKMKLDHEGSASPAPTPIPTPATTATPGFSAAQWTTSQIPIDPALSQTVTQPPVVQQNLMSYYQPYTQTTHYGQTAYSSPLQHYQHYQTTQPIPPAPVSRQPTQTHDNDGADLSNLNDALGSAGVDLRAEEETLQRSHDHHQAYRPYEDRTRRQGTKFAFDNRTLGATMREVGTRHKVMKIPEDSVNYLALALRARLQGLIKAMITASQHRVEAQHNREPSLYEDGTPMWSVVIRRDAQKQLEALEKAEREEEMRYRRERKERADAAAAQAAAAAQSAGNALVDGGDDPMDGSSIKKSKKKKDGPGVTAKNMSEDAQKRLANATATQAAGLGRGKYAWMTAGNLATPSPKPKLSATSSQSPGVTTATASTTHATSASSWVKPYVPTNAKTDAPADEDNRRPVTMRDALFVIEKERGHGAGQGAAKIWI